MNYGLLRTVGVILLVLGMMAGLATCAFCVLVA